MLTSWGLILKMLIYLQQFFLTNKDCMNFNIDTTTFILSSFNALKQIELPGKGITF